MENIKQYNELFGFGKKKNDMESDKSFLASERPPEKTVTYADDSICKGITKDIMDNYDENKLKVNKFHDDDDDEGYVYYKFKYDLDGDEIEVYFNSITINGEQLECNWNNMDLYNFFKSKVEDKTKTKREQTLAKYRDKYK